VCCGGALGMEGQEYLAPEPETDLYVFASGGERAHDRRSTPLRERVTHGDTLRGQPRRGGGGAYGDDIHKMVTQGDRLLSPRGLESHSHAIHVRQPSTPPAPLTIESALELFGLQPLYTRATFNPSFNGDCQFRALAHHLMGSGDHHGEVRRRAVAELRAYPFRYEHFAEEWDVPGGSSVHGRTYEQWLHIVATPGLRGGNATLLAASNAFVRPVHVVSLVRGGSVHYTAVEPSNGGSPGDPGVWVAYTGDYHVATALAPGSTAPTVPPGAVIETLPQRLGAARQTTMHRRRAPEPTEPSLSPRRRLQYPPYSPSLRLSPAASMGSQDPPEPPAHPRPAQYVSARGQPSSASALHVGSSVGVFSKKLGHHTPGTVEHVYKADDGQLVLHVRYWVGQQQYQKTVRAADCKRLDAVPQDDGPLQRVTAASTSDSSVLPRPLVGAHADGDETHDPGSSRRASRCCPRPCCPDPAPSIDDFEPVGQTQPWVGLTYRPRERIAPGNDVGPPVEMTLEDAMRCANDNPTIKGFTFDEREAGGHSPGTLIRVWFKGKGAHLTDDSWRRSELLHENDWASYIKGLPQDEQGEACFFNPEKCETVQELGLVRLFTDGEASVRRFAVEALGQLAPRRLADYRGHFVPLLSAQEAEVRQAAVTGLGRLEPVLLAGNWDDLVRRLGDSDIGVREAVVMALGQLLHSPRDAPPGLNCVPPDDPARDRCTQRDIRKLLAVTRQLESQQAGNDGRQRRLSSLTPNPGGQSTIIDSGLRYYQSSSLGTKPGLTWLSDPRPMAE
jgi:hypothetical protein